MSGFKELIQNTIPSVFSVLIYRNIIAFEILVLTSGTMVGGKRCVSKPKIKTFLILLHISVSIYSYMRMELLQAMASTKYFADSAFHTIPFCLMLIAAAILNAMQLNSVSS